MQLGGVNLIVAFLAGLVSCISPCVLPLAPIYVGNLAGGSAATVEVDRRAPILHGLAFMAGFVLLFIALGASVGLIGYALRDELPLLQKIGGILVIMIGLHMSGLLKIPAPSRSFGIDWDMRLRRGYVRSFVAGSSISAGWLPCIGPTLGAILTLALASGTVVQSSILLVAYSLGLTVPFVGLGALLSRTPPALRWMNRHHRAISFASGLVFVAMGVLLFTGTLQWLNSYFRFSSSGLGAQI